MIRLLAQILTLLALFFGIVWAAAAALGLWPAPVSRELSPMTAAAPEPSVAVAEPAHPALSDFAQTLARPVFFEGRRLPNPQSKQIKAEPPKPPPPAAPPPPPKPVVLPDKIKLLGVFMRVDAASALIETPPHPATWFKIGDRIADWTITAIEENKIVLRHDSARSATLPLYSEAPSK